MMSAVRRELIATEVAQQRYMSVEDVAARFGCSSATVRRDLQALAADGRLQRSRGGAVALLNGQSGLAAPLTLQADAGGADPLLDVKRRLGQAAAALVQDGETIGIGGGTTVLEVARCLRGRRIGVVTNAIDHALELAAVPGARVVLVGGVLDYAWGREMVGPLAELMLSHLSMDTLFTSVNGISAEAGLSVIGDFDAQVLRAMCARARRVIVVADHTKIGRAALAAVLPISGVHLLITDAGAGDDLDAIKAAGVRVLEV